MAASFLATYDPDKVAIILNGEEVYGFPDGDMVTVERNEDLFNNMVGTKGEVSRALNRNTSGTITIRLQHTSPFIKRIMEYALADSTGGIPPIMNFIIKDPSSNDQIIATQCWLNTDATHNWSNEVGVREFQFFAVNVVSAPNTNLAAGQAFASLLGNG